MKEIITTFIAIFLAEIADKTQFAIISFSAKSLSPVNIWVGATLAFCVTNFIGVVLGYNISKFFPLELVKYISGSVFIIIGVLTIIYK
ncbi:MAG: TMEM165/GDT1 family protein [Endomicrobia bacterium]|nr:TMEM165/GDT1 family protein [Endomicrobiia bacterium]